MNKYYFMYTKSCFKIQNDSYTIISADKMINAIKIFHAYHELEISYQITEDIAEVAGLNLIDIINISVISKQTPLELSNLKNEAEILFFAFCCCGGTNKEINKFLNKVNSLGYKYKLLVDIEKPFGFMEANERGVKTLCSIF